MFVRHVTQVVFWGSLALSLVSLGLTVLLGDDVIVLLTVSTAANLAVLYRNEQGGFVRSRELRRAYEPARHLNAAQLITIFFAVVAQCMLGAYVLIS